MMTDINWTFCHGCFAMYANTESCCTPKTNIVLYVEYTTTKKKKKKRKNAGALSMFIGCKKK